MLRYRIGWLDLILAMTLVAVTKPTVATDHAYWRERQALGHFLSQTEPRSSDSLKVHRQEGSGEAAVFPPWPAPSNILQMSVPLQARNSDDKTVEPQPSAVHQYVLRYRSIFPPGRLPHGLDQVSDKWPRVPLQVHERSPRHAPDTDEEVIPGSTTSETNHSVQHETESNEQRKSKEEAVIQTKTESHYEASSSKDTKFSGESTDDDERDSSKEETTERDQVWSNFEMTNSSILELANYMYNSLISSNHSGQINPEGIQKLLFKLLEEKTQSEQTSTADQDELFSKKSSIRRKRSSDKMVKTKNDTPAENTGLHSTLMVMRDVALMMRQIDMTGVMKKIAEINKNIGPLKKELHLAEKSIKNSLSVYTTLSGSVLTLRDKFLQMRSKFSKSVAFMLKRMIKMKHDLEECSKNTTLSTETAEANNRSHELWVGLQMYRQLERQQLKAMATLKKKLRSMENCSEKQSLNDTKTPEPDKQPEQNLTENDKQKISSRAISETKPRYDPIIWKQFIIKILQNNMRNKTPDLDHLKKIHPHIDIRSENGSVVLTKLKNILKLLSVSNLESKRRKKTLSFIIELIMNNKSSFINKKQIFLRALKLVLKHRVGSNHERNKIRQLMKTLDKPTKKHTRSPLNDEDREKAVDILKKLFCSKLEEENQQKG